MVFILPFFKDQGLLSSFGPRFKFEHNILFDNEITFTLPGYESLIRRVFIIITETQLC